MRLAIITSFLNEEGYLGRLLQSLDRQQRPPDRLLLVDDGSIDSSAEIAQRFVDAHPYATLLRRPSRPPEPDRLATAAELRSFQWALERLEDNWDVVAKLDADIELTPATLQSLEGHFAADPRLGIAGPYLSVARSGAEPVRQRGRPEHVAGPVKFYRRRCYEEIGDFPAILGWDTFDDIAARRAGWRTASFAMPDGDPLHLRPVGAHDGLPRAWRRWGRCAWGYGEHPLLVALVAAQRMRDPPFLVGSANYVLGYLRAAAAGAPRADPDLREYVRRQQLARIRRRLLTWPPGKTEPADGATR